MEKAGQENSNQIGKNRAIIYNQDKGGYLMRTVLHFADIFNLINFQQNQIALILNSFGCFLHNYILEAF